MERLFVHTAPFLRCWENMGLGDNELRILENALLENPEAGDLIQGTGGARKVRIVLHNNKGKSGGGRVIYLDILKKERIYLLFAYPKNVQENLTDEQKNAILQMVKKLKGED